MDPWFLYQIKEISTSPRRSLTSRQNVTGQLRKAKRLGLSDERLGGSLVAARR